MSIAQHAMLKTDII